LSTAAHALLANHDVAAQAAAFHAVTEGTHSKRNRYFGYYSRFLEWLELDHDPFLDTLEPFSRTRVIGAFADAYRLGRFSPAAVSDPRASGTCRDAVDAVAEAYRSNRRCSPCHDSSGKFSKFLSDQLKGYKNHDPSARPQKALTPSILRELSRNDDGALNRATHQLARGAFFFAMRSCEYLTVPGERRTKRLRLGNLKFIRHKRTVRLDDPFLALSDTIAITFEFQKNDERDETVVMHCSGDPLLCPIRAWAAVVTRILSYPGTTASTFVNAYETTGGKLGYLTGDQVRARLRLAASRIGADRLGFAPTEIGTHSIRSGSAMAMYLAGVPAFTIMLIGRWSSDAFLRYIRRQVQEFSAGVSSKMLLTDEFFAVSGITPEDPRVSGNSNNFSGRGLNIGLTAQNRAMTPAFSLHH
jgi:hypothetical protein